MKLHIYSTVFYAGLLFGAQNKDFSSDMTSGDQTNFPNFFDFHWFKGLTARAA